ncbi:MAG: septum formation initiator family protein [Bacteroidota bacterium]
MKKKRVFRLIRNKYFVVTLFLGIWIVFFDKNDVFSQLELAARLKELEKERDYYREEIARNRKEMQELKTNTASLEKFAREKYLMKKDNEEVFIIVKEGKSNNQ